MVAAALAERGWVRFPAEAAVRRWADAALPLARWALTAPDGDWRCGGTWFVGVDVLANDDAGAVMGVPLAGGAAAAVAGLFGLHRLHRAQLSAIRPGYPKPGEGESQAAFRYRLCRDAAHVDGLLPIGPDKRRMLREPHAFVLGLPLTTADPDAAPLVVWDGSHRIMARAFRRAFAPHAPERWADVDVTAIYQDARREVFATCPRLALPAQPGEAVLLDRHLLHGVAPWAEGAKAAPEGRIIAYFRPQLPSAAVWMGA